LRIKTEAMEKIDEAIKNRIGITRTTWILEAIHEKLKKENKKNV
jgi:metal-responsive CopG/Arc/MetJ family transcriptional regulator